jgi:hypothetical protein
MPDRAWLLALHSAQLAALSRAPRHFNYLRRAIPDLAHFEVAREFKTLSEDVHDDFLG